ncbi:response regulator [Falsigemmobacter intermedius]|uniref:histidine kinase n=1 Tax=Falsigemmobacter intermedius TaxID=1553448 RepID=A0A451GH84_9RHOB|nr:hybrid sensor histidine kinase/response regulator [Falsigemmobacter intermedius]RWY37414.1 response regulator [Falsigemmobacter intermedius]
MPTALPEAQAAPNRQRQAEAARPILQALARVMVTDRRAVTLASARGEILLANLSSQRLGIDRESLLQHLDWQALCNTARRSGSAAARWQRETHSFEGEVVHVPLGSAEGFLLRLAESDQESTWLRNRARAATLMRVAHDLRTPIQSLLASAEALTRRDGPGLTEETAHRMRRAAGLALDQVSNVLSVIRGEQSLRGGQPDEDFRLADEVTALVALVEPIAAARATEVVLTLETPPDLTLHGPLRFVRALCQNLIDNSVNHGGGRVELRLTAKPLSAALPLSDGAAELWRVQMELSDEGGGLPAEHRARLAEVLARPGDAEGRDITGSDQRPSAGLSVLAHALRQLGGEMTVADRGADCQALPAQSEERVIGTVFTATFTLPRAPALPQPAAEPQGGGALPLAARQILLVEDSPSSRDWITHMLRHAGAEVTSVGSGPEALALLARVEYATRIELVLTDVTLPRMTGIELAERLSRGDPAASLVWRGPVVGLTAHADDRIRAACLRAGMVTVLEKPIQAEDLASGLNAVLSGSAPAPRAAAAGQGGDSPIDAEVSQSLISQIGVEKARDFMLRALREARQVQTELLRDGIGPDTGRRLHAATGACGLTGLRAIERVLRLTEAEVAVTNPCLEPLCDQLDDALSRTEQAIGELGA